MLFPYLMKVSLLLAVLTLGYRWLIQFETFSKLNRALLWLNALAAWLLPLVPLPAWGPLRVQTEFHHHIPKVVGKMPILAEPISAVQSGTFQVPATPALPALSLSEWILMIYLAGVSILAALFLVQVGRLLMLVVKSRKEQWDYDTKIINVPGSTPYSFFHWIILDPNRHSESELRNILAHETEHARQWHSADLLMAELSKILLWFNPFVWVHQKLVQENLEYLADRAVLNNGFEKKQYQYNLLNTVMRSHELPLTNSFAQSLLKKRIKMMNRKPSQYMAWAKYATLIALIYISSAFVAPFRERIVALAPAEIRPLVKPLVAEVVIPEAPKLDEPAKNEPDKSETNTKPEPKTISPAADTTQIRRERAESVKGVLIRNDTIYWAITPLMDWDDINEVRKAVNKFGAELAINKIQFDPFQQFITSISVTTRNSRGQSGAGSRNGEDDFSPIKGHSGYILEGGIGMGQLPPAPLINALTEDYEKALLIKKENEVAYFQQKITTNIGAFSTTVYLKDALTGKSGDKLFVSTGIGKSNDDNLRIADTRKEHELYINTQPATFQEMNALAIERIEKVTVINGTPRKMIIAYTK
ncbi:M56 family metallopeptidase [Dyadobacter crusticola]|uniref:M56 family metallopeptidase n=1 Tax=Dyadobacter crusticola TaxID=292407 RepID=UPI0004E1A935|nr:M56 family metallopeptidase [Dyadobacter crusticola]